MHLQTGDSATLESSRNKLINDRTIGTPGAAWETTHTAQSGMLESSQQATLDMGEISVDVSQFEVMRR